MSPLPLTPTTTLWGLQAKTPAITTHQALTRPSLAQWKHSLFDSSTDQDSTATTCTPSHDADNDKYYNTKDNDHTPWAAPAQVPSYCFSPPLSRTYSTVTLDNTEKWEASAEIPSGCLSPLLTQTDHTTLDSQHIARPILGHLNSTLSPAHTLTFPPLSPIPVSLYMKPLYATQI